MCSRFLYLHSPVERSSDGISTGRATLCFWHKKNPKRNLRRSRPTVCLRGGKLSGSTRKKEPRDNWASPACLQPSFRNKWNAAQTCEEFICAADDDDSDAKRLADFDRSCETLATDSQYVAVESRLQAPLSRYSKKKIIQMEVEERRGEWGRQNKKRREKSQIKMCRTRQTCEYTVFRLQLLGNKCFGGKPSLRGIFNVSLIATLADRHISLLISGHDYRLRR